MRSFETMFRIALIGVFTLVIWKGIELSRFAWVQESVEQVLSPSSRQSNLQQQDRERVAKAASELEPVLAGWQNVGGVQSDAVFASIGIKRLLNPTNFRDLEAQAKSVLAARPMSAQAWMLLAGTRLLSGQPIEQATSALETGLMLAPNEDNLMAERLVYGLLIWDELSPSAKERITADLANVGQRGSAAQVANVRTIIAGKLAAARKDIRDRLERAPDRKPVVDRFGL